MSVERGVGGGTQQQLCVDGRERVSGEGVYIGGSARQQQLCSEVSTSQPVGQHTQQDEAPTASAGRGV